MGAFFDDFLPKAGLRDEDRKQLKTALSSHSAYRAHSAGTGDCSWQASLLKSGILTFELIEDAGVDILKFYDIFVITKYNKY